MGKKKPNLQFIFCFPTKNLHHELLYAKQINSYSTAVMEKSLCDTLGVKMSYRIKLMKFLYSELGRILKL